MRLLYVCLAGAVGSGLRYLVVEWCGRTPWGVFAVNVLGSFVIAIVAMASAARLPEDTRIAITAGLLGGFTTYSSFNQDTLKMIDGQRYAAAALYVGATLVLCLAAGLLGTALGRRLA